MNAVRNVVIGLKHPFFVRWTFTQWISKLHQLNFCSDETEGRMEDGGDQLEIFTGPVPREKLTVKFSRSSGPGGQNVNKLNTKAEVRFHLESADWLPQRVKERVKAMFRNRLTKEGEMVVVSQVYRTQHKNLEDAVQRLTTILNEASEIPIGPSELTLARIKVLKRKAERKRRADKKYHSMKKQDRRDDS